eukprot:6886732-Prymnesium_polylepis.1
MRIHSWCVESNPSAATKHAPGEQRSTRAGYQTPYESQASVRQPTCNLLRSIRSDTGSCSSGHGGSAGGSRCAAAPPRPARAVLHLPPRPPCLKPRLHRGDRSHWSIVWASRARRRDRRWHTLVHRM